MPADRLAFHTPLKDFERRVSIFGSTDGGVTVPGFLEAEIVHSGDATSVRLVREDFRPGRDLVMRYPVTSQKGLKIVTDRRKGV